jgi:hypothetical protein
MKEQFALVDFENVRKLDLARLPAEARIKIFVGQTQSKRLGDGICKSPQAEFVILSNDKGFDPLVRLLVARGFKCRHDGEVCPALAPNLGLPARAQAVAELLKRSEKNKRPRKRTTLHNFLATYFQKKLTAEEIKQAVEHLLEAGLIEGTEAAVTYNL